ncbi:MAG TPA: hypothetical protein VGV38_08725 [Pyrinomonadaceae bacterium]|nr:hypothetical protein [Pyrinomonadaceae bacterium]
MRDEMTNTNSDAKTPHAACGRGEDLVAFLYGETDEQSSASFRQHMHACASCREELEAFGGVRGALGVWRDEVLKVSPSLSLETADAAPPAPRPARKRSAVAALREFFDLSPLWLRAACATAAVAFCALGALTLARAEVRWDAQGFAFRTGSERVVRETVYEAAPSGPKRDELNALTAENQSLKAELESLRERPSVVPVAAKTDDEQTPPRRSADPRAADVRRVERAQRVRRPSARQLARYEDEDDLPRLSDLLEGVN